MMGIKPKSDAWGGMLLGNASILLATIFWGVNYPFTQALAPEWMTSADISTVRLAGGAVVFWIVSLFVKCERIERKDWWRIFTGGFIGLFSCIYLFVAALKYGGAIDIAIIMTLPPAFVVVMEIIFYKRRPSLLEYAGLIASFIGAAVIIAANGGSVHGANPFLGDCLAVAASLGFAIYLVVLSGPSKKYKPITLLRWVFLCAAIPVLFNVPALFRMPLWHAPAAPWLEIGFILFGPTFLAYLLVQPAERLIGSVLVALYQYLTPVVAALAAIAMGLDSLRWMQVVAMLVIVGGMILTNLGKDHNHSRSIAEHS